MPVEAPEIVETDNSRVACDGGGGALGHPKVFLEMGDETAVALGCAGTLPGCAAGPLRNPDAARIRASAYRHDFEAG